MKIGNRPSIGTASLTLGSKLALGAVAVAGPPIVEPLSAPVNRTAPVISGTAMVGEELTVTPGVWEGKPVPTLTYQWRRGTSNIVGATGLKYVQTADDVGANIRCVERGSNSEGSASVSSNAIGPVQAAPAPAPTVFRDNYNRADGGLVASSGGNWSNPSGNASSLSIVNQQLATAAAEGAFLSPDLGNANQYTQHVIAGGGTVGPFIANRISDQDNWGAAGRYNVNTGAGQLWKRSGGTLTQYGSTTGSPCVVGATIRVETVADTAQLVVNGAVVAGPYAMGGAGAGVTRQGYVARTNANNPWADNYEAGHLSALTV